MYKKLQKPFYWHPLPHWYNSNGSKDAFVNDEGSLYFGETNSDNLKHGRGLIVTTHSFSVLDNEIPPELYEGYFFEG
jgi:hypothetical protein